MLLGRCEQPSSVTTTFMQFGRLLTSVQTWERMTAKGRIETVDFERLGPARSRDRHGRNENPVRAESVHPWGTRDRR